MDYIQMRVYKTNSGDKVRATAKAKRGIWRATQKEVTHEKVTNFLLTYRPNPVHYDSQGKLLTNEQAGDTKDDLVGYSVEDFNVGPWIPWYSWDDPEGLHNNAFGVFLTEKGRALAKYAADTSKAPVIQRAEMDHIIDCMRTLSAVREDYDPGHPKYEDLTNEMRILYESSIRRPMAETKE